MGKLQRFLVAEVSKNWFNGQSDDAAILSQKFEEIIAANWSRGYKLHSYQLNRVTPDRQTMNETIVAVFELRDPTNAEPK